MSETKRRAKYTLEFKLEAVRLVKGGQVASVTAKILGIPKASLDAYFSPTWTVFQAERGRDFSVIVDGISN